MALLLLLATPAIVTLNAAAPPTPCADRSKPAAPATNPNTDVAAAHVAAGGVFKHPVVLLPGLVTTPLEVWDATSACSALPLRTVLWGGSGATVAEQTVRDAACFLETLGLSPLDWRDPAGVRVRASDGGSVLGYLFPRYWVWAHLLDNLAAVGADPSQLISAAYDWRRSPGDLQRLFAWGDQLRARIEVAVRHGGGARVVIIAHSLGALWALHLLNFWPDAWVRDNVEAVIFVGPPFLGVPKSVAALVSGEMKDTAEMGRLSRLVVQSLLKKPFVATRFFRSLASIPAMLPAPIDELWDAAGGPPSFLTWGPPANETRDGAAREAARDAARAAAHEAAEQSENPPPKATYHTPTSLGAAAAGVAATVSAAASAVASAAAAAMSTETFSCDEASAALYESADNMRAVVAAARNATATGALEYIFESAPRFAQLVRKTWLLEPFENGSRPEREDERAWPFAWMVPLPNITGVTLYSFYGNIPNSTEVGYHYARSGPETQCLPELDILASDPAVGLRRGVRMGDGDTTVPLVSLGLFTAPNGPWRDSATFPPPLRGLNPHGVRAVVREYATSEWGYGDVLSLNLSLADALRGGLHNAAHVEILGHRAVLADILHIVAPLPSREPLGDQVLTNITEITAHIRTALLRRPQRG